MQTATSRVRARMIREVVDPFDQLDDIRNALDFLVGDPNVDTERIGLWGTSFSGGHVIWTGARDPTCPRDRRAGGSPRRRPARRNSIAHGQTRATAKARGDIDPIPQGIDQVEGLDGTPDWAKIVRYRPIDAASAIRVPTLFIDAEDEELFDRMENGHAAYEIVAKNAPAEYEVFPGKHYDIYTLRYPAASDRALAWFKRHLGPSQTPEP